MIRPRSARGVHANQRILAAVSKPHDEASGSAHECRPPRRAQHVRCVRRGWHWRDGPHRPCSEVTVQQAAGQGYSGPKGSRERKGSGIGSPTGSFEVSECRPTTPCPTHARFLRSPVLPSSPRCPSGADAQSPTARVSASCRHGPRVPAKPSSEPAGAAGGDALRLSTWVVNQVFFDLEDHDVSPTCRARALDVAVQLRCTSCSAPCTWTLRHWCWRHLASRWKVRPIGDRPPTECLLWLQSACRRTSRATDCNNNNTSHTRHAPPIAPSSESARTRTHLTRAHALLRAIAHALHRSPASPTP